MTARLFKLECITNLHVGNGDVNYNIIDNEVERDPVTNYPVIHSSGIKGAFREYFGKQGIDVAQIEKLFGSERGGAVPGSLKFLQADMLTMPMRASGGGQVYYYVSTQTQLDLLKEKLEMIEGRELAIEVCNGDGNNKSNKGNKSAEGIELLKSLKLEKKTIYLMEEQKYAGVSLPVMARNHLENGISQNLWYEEVVPHHSIFTFYVLADEEERMQQFINVVQDKVVQFGGSASIGYGLCRVSVFGEEMEA